MGCFPNHTKYIFLFKNACVSIYLQFDAYIFTNEKLLSSFSAIFWMFKSFELPDFVISGESMHRCCIQIKIVFVFKLPNKISLSKKSYIYIFFLTRYKFNLFLPEFNHLKKLSTFIFTSFVWLYSIHVYINIYMYMYMYIIL